MEKFRTETYSHRINELINKFHVPGLSIAVRSSDEALSKAFGHARFQPDILAKADSIYDMASASKSLTAASIAKLIAEKYSIPGTDTPITWSTPVSQILPSDFVLSDARATEETTLEDILSHRSGLPSHDDSYLGVHHATPDTPQSVTRNLRNLAMNARRLEEYQYCNMMYTIATHIVEVLTKDTFASFLQKHFFDPLNMTSTYLQPSAVEAAGQTDRIAYPHVWRRDTQLYDELGLVESPEAQGAGSIQSTVLDFAKWVQAMMTRDAALFPRDIYADLEKPRIITDPDSNEREPGSVPFQSTGMYALGWEVTWYRGYRIISHDGAIAGYGSVALYIPQLNFTIVMCGNSDGLYGVARVVTKELIDELLNVPAAERIDWVAFVEEQEREHEDKLDDRDELRQMIGEGRTEQQLPLEAYIGQYHSAGYHDVTVQVKEDRLHIDGSTRSNPIWLDFEHVRDDKFFIVALSDVEKEIIAYLRAEFVLDKQNKVTAVGINFCEEMKHELVWFERTKGVDS